MAINSNSLTLGTSVSAKTHFQAAASSSSSSPGSAEAQSVSTPASQGSGACSSDQAAGAPSSNAGNASGGSGTQKGAAATAQTRNAPTTAARGKTRTRSVASGSNVAQASIDCTSNDDSPTTDFGSVMATALGRSAASTPETAAKASPGADPAPDTAVNSSPTASPTPDAMAWVAQVLMPNAPATSPDPATSQDTDSTPDGTTTASPGVAATTHNDNSAGVATALQAPSSDPATDSASADLQARPAATAQLQEAAQAAASQAAQLRAETAQKPPGSSGSGSDAASSSRGTTGTGAADLNALADVQKLITGLTAKTAADSSDGTDSDAVTAPAARSTAADAGSDTSQAAAALQAAGLNRSSDALGSATLTIHAPVGTAAFANEVSHQVSTLAQSGLTQAQLQLNPSDLGPVQVHITMQAGQASVWFGANHADTRAALEQSLPRLREMFAGAGMPLADSGVFREPPRQQQAQSTPSSTGFRDSAPQVGGAATVTQVSNIRLSLLDTYA